MRAGRDLEEMMAERGLGVNHTCVGYLTDLCVGHVENQKSHAEIG